MTLLPSQRILINKYNHLVIWDWGRSPVSQPFGEQADRANPPRTPPSWRHTFQCRIKPGNPIVFYDDCIASVQVLCGTSEGLLHLKVLSGALKDGENPQLEPPLLPPNVRGTPVAFSLRTAVVWQIDPTQLTAHSLALFRHGVSHPSVTVFPTPDDGQGVTILLDESLGCIYIFDDTEKRYQAISL